MNEPSIGELVMFSDLSIGVPGDGAPIALATPDEVSEHVRTDSLGRYRPLSGAKTLPRGWKFTADDVPSLAEAVDGVYPLAATHSRQQAEGSLRVIGLDEVLRRQSGRYETSSALQEAGRQRASRILCGECVRTPVWRGAELGVPGIPCPEPCSVLVALCREASLWEREPPPPSPPDPHVAWAAFETPGNELRERYLAEGTLSP